MKLSEMKSYINDENNVIGFLHRTEHDYLQSNGINTRSQCFNNVIQNIIENYQSKLISNKKASELINICVSANPAITK